MLTQGVETLGKPADVILERSLTSTCAWNFFTSTQKCSGTPAITKIFKSLQLQITNVNTNLFRRNNNTYNYFNFWPRIAPVLFSFSSVTCSPCSLTLSQFVVLFTLGSNIFVHSSTFAAVFFLGFVVFSIFGCCDNLTFLGVVFTPTLPSSVPVQSKSSPIGSEISLKSDYYHLPLGCVIPPFLLKIFLLSFLFGTLWQ